MSVTDEIKALLSGSIEEQLEVIETWTKERLCIILNVSEVPQSLSYIVKEVSLKRWNRIGNEGMQSFSQEGLSMTFPESDFDEYRNEIEEWKDQQADEDGTQRRGRFRLL